MNTGPMCWSVRSLTKESGEAWTEEELFPVDRICYEDPEGYGGYGPVSLTMKDGRKVAVDFEGSRDVCAFSGRELHILVGNPGGVVRGGTRCSIWTSISESMEDMVNLCAGPTRLTRTWTFSSGTSWWTPSPSRACWQWAAAVMRGR